MILRRILPQALPWVTFLPVDAVDELVAELVATLQAAVSIDNQWPVSQLLVEWRHTAEIYADPVLYEAATRVLGEDGGPVPPPDVRGRRSFPIRGPSRRANATTSSSTLSRLASTEAGPWNSGSTR